MSAALVPSVSFTCSTPAPIELISTSRTRSGLFWPRTMVVGAVAGAITLTPWDIAGPEVGAIATPDVVGEVADVATGPIPIGAAGPVAAVGAVAGCVVAWPGRFQSGCVAYWCAMNICQPKITAKDTSIIVN